MKTVKKNIGGWPALVTTELGTFADRCTISYDGPGGAIISSYDEEEAEGKFIEAMQLAESVSELINLNNTMSKKGSNDKIVNHSNDMRAVAQPTVFDIPLAEFGEKILKAKSRQDAHKLAMEITNDFFKCRDKIAYRAEERGKAVGKDELRAEFRDLLGIAKKQTVDIG